MGKVKIWESVERRGKMLWDIFVLNDGGISVTNSAGGGGICIKYAEGQSTPYLTLSAV